MALPKFTRGSSSGVNSEPLVDGQILFDEENKSIHIDHLIDGTLTRITMKDSQFTGTAEEWETLSDEEKAKYTIVNITDDYETHTQTFVGATATENGKSGTVTRPLAGDQDKFLKGDGSWSDVAVNATNVPYDPTDSGLAATNLQEAVDEVVASTSELFDEAIPTFIDTSTPVEPSDKIYQYLGENSGDFVKGYFYRIEEVTPATDPKTYHWVRSDVQPASSTINVIDNLNSTSTTDALSANQGKVLGDKLPFGLSITNDTYGYEKADGTFVPFKSQADIDSAVAAAMVGTATAADVLAPKTFTNSTTSGEVGTMVDNGAVSKTLDATTNNQSYTVPQGYHNGSGTVNIVLEEKSVTPSSTSQTVTPTSGKVLSKVTVEAAAGANLQNTKAEGTVTPSANWSGSSTSSYTITKDNNYDGMVNATFSVPMIRDDNIFQYVSSGTPATVYHGDSSYSNSKELMKIAPYKDGMVYTNSYLYVDPTAGGWSKGGTTHTGYYPSSSGSTSVPLDGSVEQIDLTASHSYRYVRVKAANHSGYSDETFLVSSSDTYIDLSANHSFRYASISVSANPTETVLWTNSSPSSSFASQLVTLSQYYTNFDCIAIEYRMDTTQSIGPSGKRIIVESDQFLGMNEAGSYGLALLACPSSTWYVRRVHSGASHNIVSFKACYQYGTTTTANNKCIPYQVIGIKY